MEEMVSFGAGVNSTAMIVALAKQDWRGPIVFADTGNENPKTYCYMDYFEREFLHPHELEIIRISPSTHSELYDDKRVVRHPTLEDFCLAHKIVPYLGTRWCSVQFKVKPLQNWCRLNGYNKRLMGICTDEPSRVHYNNSTIGYPLVDAGIDRKECMRIIQRAGLEVPPKSGCFFCPGQSLGGWRALYYDYPELYERAVRMEENASRNRKKLITLDPKGISLLEKARKRWKSQEQMDLSRWLPCACSL